MSLLSDTTFGLYASDGKTPVPGLAIGAVWLNGGPFVVPTGQPRSAPSIGEKGGGLYTVGRYQGTEHVCGWIDFGGSAGKGSRWQFYESGSGNGAAFGLRASGTGAPLPGKAPGTWAICVDIVTGLAVTPPVVAELVAGSGIYVAPDVAAAGQHIAGICAFDGASQTFEYDSVGSGVSTAPPTGTSTSAPLMTPLAVALTQQDFLDLFDRLFPRDYLAAMKAGGDGYEFFQALARVGARLSTAIVNLERAGCLLAAPTAAKATGTVMIYRDAPNENGLDVTIKAGSQVKASLNGQRFLTTQDLFLAASAVGSWPVTVQAVAPGYEYNVLGQVTTAQGEIIPGEIDTIVRLVEDPAFGETSVYVQQLVDTTGGTPGSLEQQGIDRGLAMRPGESAAAYRYRIRQLSDTVSPGAIERAVAQWCAPKNCAYSILETFDEAHFGCWDAPAASGTNPNYNPLAFCYDEDAAHRPYWLDARDGAATFVVIMEQIASILELGGAWDDPAVNTADWMNPLGLRAVFAWDETAAAGSAYDGNDIQGQAFYAGLWDLLQSIRAGGVAADLELQGQ